MGQGMFVKLHRSSRGSFITRICLYGFLLAQLPYLMSEIFPPLFLTPGKGLSVVGSWGCVWQPGEMGFLFLLWLLIFALFFLRLVLIVNSDGSQHQAIRWVIKPGWSPRHTDGSFFNRAGVFLPPCTHAKPGYLWSFSVQQDAYFAIP